MLVAIADTHATVWYLFSDPRLGREASAFIEETAVRGDHIGVSAITIAEMVYPAEKHKIPANALVDLQTAIADSNAVLQHVPLDEKIATKMAGLSRLDIPDLPDRVIAATAVYFNVPLLSRDRKIRPSNVHTIW